MRSWNFTPDENVYHLAVDDTAVAGCITSTIINGGVINSDSVLSYREEDSRPYNPIHYSGARWLEISALRCSLSLSDFLLDYNPSTRRDVSYA